MSTTLTDDEDDDRYLFRSPLLDDMQPSPDARRVSTALVVLNAPMSQPPSLLVDRLWQQSTFRVCADGGANRLYAATIGTPKQHYLPDLIRGDLDSLDDTVRDYYQRQGVTVEQDPDQDSNDLDKALTAVVRQSIRRCLVYGAFGGRFDQEMAALQALYRWQAQFDQVWLYNDNTCAVLLPGKGVRNRVQLVHYGDVKPASGSVGEGPTCGLIPLGEPCASVTTDGLRWNLQDSRMEFGGLVSTSNHVEAETVVVTSSSPLIFTAEVHAGARDNPWVQGRT